MLSTFSIKISQRQLLVCRSALSQIEVTHHIQQFIIVRINLTADFTSNFIVFHLQSQTFIYDDYGCNCCCDLHAFTSLVLDINKETEMHILCDVKWRWWMQEGDYAGSRITYVQLNANNFTSKMIYDKFQWRSKADPQDEGFNGTESDMS